MAAAEDAKRMKHFIDTFSKFINEHGVVVGGDEVAGVQSELERMASTESSSNGFDWMESMLVRAMRSGTWILFDNANYCNPSVLDRLNGVLETHGVLDIGEQGCSGAGDVPKIKPHKGKYNNSWSNFKNDDASWEV